MFDKKAIDNLVNSLRNVQQQASLAEAVRRSLQQQQANQQAGQQAQTTPPPPEQPKTR